MSKRHLFTDRSYAYFITFSCYKRRRLLDTDQSRRIVLGNLSSQLAKQEGRCIGFVLMPDHVHALVWFPQAERISIFMNKWKEHTSHRIKEFLRSKMPSYWSTLGENDPVWQRRYYVFHVETSGKVEEKLNYLHENPVRARLVSRAVDWRWSSARWYLERRAVGVPISWPDGAFL